MKLFQQLLVAPAALGLMAPIAATAAELNIQGVSEYSAPSEVQSISEFSDVYPTDWAYQALVKLAERQGCVASNPSGSMTRYEAAALLNKCLENVTQANAEERRLLNEFAPELAVIKGRIDDGLEVGIGEAGGFSSTTKVSGTTTFVVGAVSNMDSVGGGTGGHTGKVKNTTSYGVHSGEAVVFNYDTKINLESSFRGDDLLVTRLRSSNFTATDPFGASGQTTLEVANDTTDQLKVERNYYQFPVGDNFDVTVGAKVRQDDMLGVWPSDYPSDSVLDVLTYAGANATYALATGAGAGVTYSNGNISISGLFVSEEANSADASSGGVLSDGGSDDYTGQIAWSNDGITIAAAYTVADNGNTTGAADADDYTSWGLSAVYQTDTDSQLIPTSISLGYGEKSVDKTDDSNNIEDETTWSIGLQWEDAFIDGNTLGVAMGTAEGHRDDAGYDDPMAYELFYSMAVSDSITVTPALFGVEKDNAENIWGGLVKTTFSF